MFYFVKDVFYLKKFVNDTGICITSASDVYVRNVGFYEVEVTF